MLAGAAWRCLARPDPTQPSDSANLIDWWPFFVSAACAGTLMALAIGVRSIGRDESRGVQSLHRIPTSRLGGIVIVIACAATLAVFLAFGRGHWPPELPLALAAVPVVLFGLAEDLTRRVRPRYRMGAAVVSAMLASAYSGGIVPRLDLPLVDELLKRLDDGH
jgi:UDP-N-acetylmuramyl pentapeptide phosphotransferase/UDP-N-acetylglucosamine-1-phosphate transferase